MTELREITTEELKEILRLHELWWQSAYRDGARANLSYTDLSEANLFRANLSEAILSGADLSGADLSEANIIDTILVNPEDVLPSDTWLTIEERNRRRLEKLAKIAQSK